MVSRRTLIALCLGALLLPAAPFAELRGQAARQRRDDPAASGRRTRFPAVAGQFYPAAPAELASMVDGFLAQASAKAPEGRLVALIVPHAGYVYSGAVAARAYKIVRPGAFDAVVLVGTAHHVPVKGAALDAAGTYACPLKEFPVDEPLSSALRRAGPLFEDFPDAHEGEHSIEVQLPFLARRLPRATLVPIVMNTEDLSRCRAIGEGIARAVGKRRALLIASTDLSHYPDADLAEKVDRTALRALASLDPDYLWRTNRVLLNRSEPNLSCTFCGEGAALAVLYAAKELGANAAVLLQYTNSGRLPIGDRGRAVGYAAVALVQTTKPQPPPAQPELTPERKNALLSLARQTLTGALKTEAPSRFALQEDPELNLPAAVFVTLKKDGRLRGCVGQMQPQFPLAEAVQRSALSSAFEDPRFSSLRKEELPELEIEISVLSPMSPVASADAIVPGKHGVVVSRDGRSGVFLPSVWEQIPSKEPFLSELCAQKAGLPEDCWKDPATRLLVFTADHFSE